MNKAAAAILALVLAILAWRTGPYLGQVIEWNARHSDSRTAPRAMMPDQIVLTVEGARFTCRLVPPQTYECALLPPKDAMHGLRS